MRLSQHYSGSGGNLYEVTGAKCDRLLIDPGVTWKKVQAALDYNLKGIRACLLTHEHMDHAKAVEDVMQAGIDVYASEGTLKALGVRGHRRALVVCPGMYFVVGGFKVYAFETHHDAASPLGFAIQEMTTDRKLLFATDTSHISQHFKLPFSIIAIEASYDQNVLAKRVETGEINETLARRLLTSHMEWRTTETYLDQFCDLSRCEQIHLLHMSDENIVKERVQDYIQRKFFIETVVA